MAKEMSEEAIYAEAKRRVKERRDFYGHLAAYVGVNILLVFIWAFASGGGYPWFLWPLVCWGVFVLLHYLRVFVFERKGDRAAIEKEAEKIRKEQD